MFQHQQATVTAKRARVDEEENEDEESVDDEIDLDNLKAYITPDILICGNCRLESHLINPGTKRVIFNESALNVRTSSFWGTFCIQ